MTKIQVPVGETILGNVNLTFVEIIGAGPGPTLGLISGIHGNEISSVGGLLSFLESMREISPSNLCGRILALPFANPFGLARRERGVDGKDLNRSFPGDPKGSIHERITSAILNFFRSEGADLVIDLHTMNPLSLPFVILERVSAPPDLCRRTRDYADKFGVGVVFDLPPEEYVKDRLDNSSSARILSVGIPSFTVEVPGVFYSPSVGEATIYSGLWNVVRGLKVVPMQEYLLWQHPSRMRVGVGIHSRFPGPKAERAGFFRHCVSPGDWAEKGGVLGEILGVDGEILEKVVSPESGLVADIIDAAMVQTGVELFELMVPEKK